MANLLSGLFGRLIPGAKPLRNIPEYSVHPPGVTFLTEVTVGRWVEEGFSTDFASVGSLVPDRYESCARVLHPAWDESDRMVRWTTVAEWAGRVHHSVMSFEGISSPAPGHGVSMPPWCRDPEHGAMEEEVSVELAALLAQFTATSQECYFGVWEGYGQYSGGIAMITSEGRGGRLGTPRDIRRARRIKGVGRNYLLYRGRLEDITGFYANFLSEPPNIWWPADRAWFVSTDIDLDSTYVGGSQQCINALLRHPVLEAVPAEYRASVAMEADTANLGDPK